MYYVVRYAPHPTGFGRVREVYPAHRAYVDREGAAGRVWLIGTFADAANDGAMCLFRSRADADRFLTGDPFVSETIVVPSAVLPWEPLEFPPSTPVP
ncbi:MAG TPA: YciI family protein [Amnibacterium sp.]|jgi:hypothetical protein|nr:YciI family protein [Amnibacterium sp.]